MYQEPTQLKSNLHTLRNPSGLKDWEALIVMGSYLNGLLS